MTMRILPIASRDVRQDDEFPAHPSVRFFASFNPCRRVHLPYLLLPLRLLIAMPAVDGEKPGRLPVQRGLLDAPTSLSAKALANITAVASVAAHAAITLEAGTNLLDEYEGVDGTHDRTSRITTEIAPGAHLVVDDVTVVTPTGT